LTVVALSEWGFPAILLALRNETGARTPLPMQPLRWKDYYELLWIAVLVFSSSYSKSLNQAIRCRVLLSLLELPVVWRLEKWRPVWLRILAAVAAAAAARDERAAVAPACGDDAGCGGIVAAAAAAAAHAELFVDAVATVADSAADGVGAGVAAFFVVAVADSSDGERCAALLPHPARFDLANRHLELP